AARRAPPPRALPLAPFPGARRTDVLTVAGDRWRIMRAPGAALEPWNQQLVGDVSRLVAADFDGDDRTDIAWFEPGGFLRNDRWKISKAGAGAAVTLRDNADQDLVSLPVGRFDDTPGADALYWHNDLWLRIYAQGVTDGAWSRQSMR